jgi:lipopolysaccharide heptosyltransferase II
LLKPCCLGDVLMATPVLAALRRGYPQAHIAFAAGASSQSVLKGNPHVDEMIDCGKVGSGRYGLGDCLDFGRALRRRRFDLAIILDRSPALSLLALLAGIPHRVGLDSRGRGFAHTLRVPVDWEHPKHEADLYLDCARVLGLQVVDPHLEFYPSADDRAFAAGLLAQPGEDPLSGTPYVAIHPGGAVNPGMTLLAKRWLPDRFAAVADRLATAYGARIILVGAPSDAEAADAVAQAMHNTPLSLVGNTTLGQLAAVYEHCALMIGNDSGVMHLAVAVRTPVVAVFGPSDPRIYGPYGPHSIAIRKDAQCAERCFAPGRGLAVHCDRQCIEAVSVDDVWEAAQALLGEPKESHPVESSRVSQET